MLGSPARKAATSAPRSKSSVWMLTRAMAVISASGDGGEEGHLGALFHLCRFLAQRLVQRAAQRLAARQRRGMRGAAVDQQAAQVADGGAGRQLDVFSGAQGLADRGEVADVDLHAINSENGR